MPKPSVAPTAALLYQAVLSPSVEQVLAAHGLRTVARRIKPSAPTLGSYIRELDGEVIFIAGDPGYAAAMLENLRPLFSLPLIVIADYPQPEWYRACAEADDLLFMDQRAHIDLRLNAIVRTALQSMRQKRHNVRYESASSRPDSYELSVSEPKAAAFYDQLRQSIINHTNHELRTPSMQLKSAVDKLAATWKPTDQQTGMWFDYVTKASHRLVDQVLRICELAEVATLRIEQFPAHEPITVAEQWFVLNGRKQDWERVHVEVVPQPAPSIYSDRNALGRVLRELIDNALKFDVSESPVEMLVEPHPDGIRYSVTDEGVGIRDADIPHIFESFFRTDVSNITNFSGIGNGLALVKSILDILNIDIDVQSELGKGSTFSFVVPITQAAFMTALAEPAQVTSGR